MNVPVSHRAPILAVTVVVLGFGLGLRTTSAVAQPGPPKKKPAPACGIAGIPFVVGNEWTYQAAVSPIVLNEQQLSRVPKQPDSVKVTVSAVEVVGTTTTIKLTEVTTLAIVDRVDGKDTTRNETRTLETTMLCAADRLEASPESIFFAGEPGGSVGITLSDIKRTGSTYALKAGFLLGPTWSETLVGSFTAAAAEGTTAPTVTGTIDFERSFILGPPETVTTPLGIFEAPRVTVELIGQVKLSDQPDKPLDIPANMNSALWFAKGIGLVQVLNSYTHYYQLVSTNVM
jgi:hypothetical protein